MNNNLELFFYLILIDISKCTKGVQLKKYEISHPSNRLKFEYTR